MAPPGLAILVAIVPRFCRQPPVVFCLWLLVLIKLVTPPLFQVPVRLLALKPAAQVVKSFAQPPTALNQDPEYVRSAPAPSPGDPAVSHSTMLAVAPASPPSRTSFYWREMLGVLWCLGTLLYLSLVMQRVRHFRKLLRLTAPAPRELRDAACDLAKTLQLRSPPWIRITDGKISPLVWCLTPAETPVVVIPRSLLSRLTFDQQTALLAHELAHLRRGDHWARWFELAVTAIFWWQPIVWWARRELHRAGDQCCDAWVLWAFPQRARGYAEALLKTVDFLAEARIAYGLGTDNQNLPAYVALPDPSGLPVDGSRNWSCGWPSSSRLYGRCRRSNLPPDSDDGSSGPIHGHPARVVR